jgi:cytochrome c556
VKKTVVAAGVVFALGAVGGAAIAQVKPETLVKQRQSAMTLIGKYFGPLGGMAQGRVPFDAKVVQRNADYLVSLTQMPWDGKFKEAADRLQSEVGKLQSVAKGGDEGAIKSQIGAVGKACAGCHDNFRQKQ